MNSDSKLMYFRLLPPEILEMIWEYVDPLTKSSIDRENYQKHYNYRIRNISENENVERFVRFLIVKDYAFVLRNVLIEKFDNWFNIKNYHYKYAVDIPQKFESTNLRIANCNATSIESNLKTE